jgi:hypothetical protein
VVTYNGSNSGFIFVVLKVVLIADVIYHVNQFLTTRSKINIRDMLEVPFSPRGR